MGEMSTLRLIGLATLLAVIAVVLIFISSWGKSQRIAAIGNYDQCVAAGYPILESYPSQCKTPDGRTFVNSNEQVNPIELPAPASSSTPEKPSQGVETRPSGSCAVAGSSQPLFIQ